MKLAASSVNVTKPRRACPVTHKRLAVPLSSTSINKYASVWVSATHYARSLIVLHKQNGF